MTIFGKYLRTLLLVTLLPLLAACASLPAPQVPLDPKAELTSLSSTVRVTVEAAGKKISADGYLLYRRPDLFRLTILNPIGLTAAEIFLNGKELTYIQGGTGYRGLVSEIPDARGIRSWRMIGWVMEKVEPQGAGPLVREREGVRETVYFDDRGLMLRKTTDQGDEISYADYLSLGGIAVAGTVTTKDREGDTVRIKLEEPEANVPLEESSFLPNLENVTLRPLTTFPTAR